MRNIVGLKSVLLKIFAFSVVVEAIGLLLPIGTQLVTDHVIMAHDQSLLSVICIGLVFFTLFRTFISMLRAWISLTLNTLTNIQWKTTLFDHLASLPLSFFEKRHLGDIQSRFSSLDTIRSTFTNSIVTGIIDSIMTVGLLIMLTLYGRLAGLGRGGIYFMLRHHAFCDLQLLPPRCRRAGYQGRPFQLAL